VAETDNITEAVQRLAQLVEENGLSELRYEEDDLKITLRTASFHRVTSPATIAVPSSVAPLPGATPPAESTTGELLMEVGEEAEDDSDLVRIEAPMMGVFYRAPALDAPPFIEVGDMVELGQTIGLIEAMKVFSEVPSEASGRVKAIPAQSGALVQPGEALILLEAE
jgi:hypothetical protein